MTTPTSGHSRPFSWLLGGQAISALGSQVAFMALPLIAVTLLHASPAMMGVLGALDNAPYLIFGLFVGSLVDSRRRRPLMIASDVFRAVMVATIPIAFLLNGLTFWHLCLVAFAVGIGNIVFDVACQAQLPDIVKSTDLVKANGALQTSTGIASLTAPGLVGVFIATVGAPLAMILDAISYVLSAAGVKVAGRLAGPEPATASTDTTVWSDIRTGIHVVVSDLRLRGLTGASASVSFGMNAAFAVLMVLLTQQVALGPVGIGLVFFTFAIFGAAGALTATQLARHVGAGRLLLLGPLLGALGLILIAHAGPIHPALLIVYVGSALGGWGLMTNQALAAGMRQTLAPNNLRGRVLGTMRFVEWGIMPLGSLCGGFLGQWYGVAPALIVSGVLVATASIWISTTGLSGLRDTGA